MNHYSATHRIGYRQCRGCHTAIKHLSNIVKRGNTEGIIKADISGFFENISQKKLMDMLGIRIQDKYFLMYIKRWLESGILNDKNAEDIYHGTPQGDVISPVLGNIYLHYVLDEWFETYIKQHYHNVELIRYCDDFICCCNNRDEADEVLDEITVRLSKYDLKLSDKKTDTLDFNCCNHPQFNFLGFSINHIYKDTISVKTSYKKQQQKMDKISEVISTTITNHRHLCNNDIVPIIIDKLNDTLRGWYSYYRY